MRREEILGHYIGGCSFIKLQTLGCISSEDICSGKRLDYLSAPLPAGHCMKALLNNRTEWCCSTSETRRCEEAGGTSAEMAAPQQDM